MLRMAIISGIFFICSISYSEELSKNPILTEMLCESNKLRASVGLPAQSIDERLCMAAQNHANYMARTGDFSHYTNGGYIQRARMYRFGGFVQENIAYGQLHVRGVFSTWRNSGGHWAAITSNTRKCGFGCQRSSNGQIYWVSLYGNE